MADKRPAYQWYPKDYLADEHVALMTLEQEGAYRRLLDYCWLHESIPADMDAMGRLCRVDGMRMAELWQGIEPCFKSEGDRYVNGRLQRERLKQDAHRKSKIKAGKAGAKARWGKDKNGSAKVVPMAKDGSASASTSASASSSSTPVSKGKKPEIDLPDGWKPTNSHRERATKHSLDIDEQAEMFTSWHGSKGHRFVSWNAAFTTWLMRAPDFVKAKSTAEQIMEW